MTVPPDQGLPGLDVALDPHALLGLLSEAFDPAGPRPELLAATVVDVQLRPGERCLVLYRLRLRPPGERRSRRDLLHVLALPPGAVGPLPLPSARTASGLPAGIIARPELALELRPFPIDPRLPWLGDAVDPAILRSRLSVAWGPRHRSVVRADAVPLSYTPESRAALELRILAEDIESGMPEQRRLVAKTHARRSPGRLFAAHWALWRSVGDAIGLAPPVGWVAGLQLALQEWLDGERLSNLFGTSTSKGPIRKAAHALAHVHRQRLPLPTVRDPKREAGAVLRWANVVRSIDPGQASRVDRLVDALLPEIARRWRPSGVVHGDFHPANVLVQDGRVYLLDWEQIAWGDPLSDVGRFLASLRTSAMRITGRPDGLQAHSDAFIETYASRAPIDEGRLRLYEAAALVTSTASPFRLQRQGWRESIDLLLGEAEQAAAAAMVRFVPVTPAMSATDGLSNRAGVTARRGATGLRAHERLEWALDPSFLLASLVPLLRESYPDTEFLGGHATVLNDYPNESVLQLDLEGDGPPAGTLFLLLGRRHMRRGLRRLGVLREATAHDGASLGLPRPIGILPSIRAAVVESRKAAARPLGASLAVDADAADRLAGALDRLGRSAVDLGRPRALEPTLASALRQIRLGHPSARALELAERAAAEIARRRRARRAGVILDGLSLSRIVDDEGRPTAVAAWKAHRGDPLLSSGQLLADLEMTRPTNTTPSREPAALEGALARRLDLDPVALRAAAALRLVLSAGNHEGANSALDRAASLLRSKD